jgi:hypothetical protein
MTTLIRSSIVLSILTASKRLRNATLADCSLWSTVLSTLGRRNKMRKTGCVIVTTGIDRNTGAGISKTITVYEHHNEWYVKKEDLDLLINLTADLCYIVEKLKKDGLYARKEK